LKLNGNDHFDQLYAVALPKREKFLWPRCRGAHERLSRTVVDRLVASGKTAYGINPARKLASVRIPPNRSGSCR